jgi:hypothetical protein
MTRKQIINRGAVPALLLTLAAGCTTPSPTTSSYHPGPVVGRTVGTGVGVVGGNAVGLVVGATEGVVGGMAAPFDNTSHMVRRWRTETTADGRTIQVPEDILVDAKGRPVGPVSAPPAPPPPPPPPPPPQP